jgi:hypothetical protein
MGAETNPLHRILVFSARVSLHRVITVQSTNWSTVFPSETLQCENRFKNRFKLAN